MTRCWSKVLAILLVAAGCGPVRAADYDAATDWPFLTAYRSANAQLGPPPKGESRVVFMGDSITEFWKSLPLQSRTGDRYVNRGISGQTTPQMLLRFRADVIELQPRVVVILAGTNDIAGNTGPASLGMIEGNLASMCELAHAHGIAIVLSSVLPASHYYWDPKIQPAQTIADLNIWLKDYAARNGFVYLDYYSPMVDARKGLKREYSEDGVHPNEAGYKVMLGLVDGAIPRPPAEH